jgi:hypothetical protein
MDLHWCVTMKCLLKCNIYFEYSLLGRKMDLLGSSFTLICHEALEIMMERRSVLYVYSERMRK